MEKSFDYRVNYNLDLSELSEWLKYDPLEGKFYWIRRLTNRPQIFQKEAGSFNKSVGYRLITYKGQKITCHRLAWIVSYGVNPTSYIDHINGDKSDNRLVNLRLADTGQNMANRKANKKSTSPYKGVSLTSRNKYKKWQARIQANKKQTLIGTFYTEEEAAKAYDIKASELFGKYALLNFKKDN